ncbi:MAG TPA: DUF4229 domain-containing protein [Nocardiopsis listeri]|uniref:DUF4229 domain-containing protein n=1 Tax=Nocardiopsis listeri TaxID=53440 RepID=UPI001DCA3EBC|nr:DUF4229 domain-containing protein [Nocardiopsis listeri]HJE57728.1 DUF4229 domain-containing protein [Nocardiopsis listeri]
MRSWLTYTAARVALFAGAFGVVYLFGARSWVALILAWVISGLASYVLLSKWRDSMSSSVVEWSNKRKEESVGDRLVGGAAREDEIQEELLSAREEKASESADSDEAITDESASGTAAEAEAGSDPEIEAEPKADKPVK